MLTEIDFNNAVNIIILSVVFTVSWYIKLEKIYIKNTSHSKTYFLQPMIANA